MWLLWALRVFLEQAMLHSMKTMNKSFISRFGVFLAALVLASSAWADTKFYGFKFADPIELQGQSLQLNGVGGRSVPVVRMRVYATALYLPEKSNEPEAIVKMLGPKRLQIRMAYGVSAKEFKKALVRGIEKITTRQSKRNCSHARKHSRPSSTALCALKAAM